MQALKRSNRYYYKPQNFIAVSGLIYRLKQNARGLSNICILSTVVIDYFHYHTIAIYRTKGNDFSSLPNGNLKFLLKLMEDEQDTLPQLVHQTAELYGMVFDKEATYHLTYIGGVYKDNMVSVYQPKIDTISSSCGIYLITLDDYNRIEGTAERVKA